MTRYATGIVAAAMLLAGPGAGAARADCAWSIGMLQADLRNAEIAAPLAADPSLELGPTAGGGLASASSMDLSERVAQAFPSGGGFEAGDPEAVTLRLKRAGSFLEQARTARIRGEEQACIAAVGRARGALDGALAAFPRPR